MNRFRLVDAFIFLFVLVLTVSPLVAQSFTSDARLVAMGGIGGHANDSMSQAGNARSYRSIGLPIGLFQVFKNTNIFRADTKEFNPLHVIELLASPLHYTFDRSSSGPGGKLASDLVKGKISRDLNDYRGFKPKAQIDSQGLISPSIGKTFRVKGDKNGANHGIYFGVGPYLAVGTDLRVDQKLIDILGASSNTYARNTSFLLQDTSNGQAAAAITVGYRARLALPGDHASSPSMTNMAGSSADRKRDGIYLSANYNYLRGFRYDTATIGVRFDTDNAGLITLAPTTTPLTVEHSWAAKGTGMAIDLGTTIVVNHWEANFSANGIGNRIDWDRQKRERFVLSNLLQGLDFSRTTVAAPTTATRIELPVQYRAGGGYNTDHWSASTEVTQGLQDLEYRAGAEFRLSVVEFRGGTQYKNDSWQPAAGLGLNLGKRFGIDAAMYQSNTNAERKRKPTLALSLRLMH